MALLISSELYSGSLLLQSRVRGMYNAAEGLTRTSAITPSDTENASGGVLQNTPNPEDLFDLMEKWDGPYASAVGLRSQLEKWRQTGAAGADWLIARTAEETEIEILTRAAMVLGEIGEPAIPAILKWIQCNASEEHQCALLQALAWIDKVETSGFAEAVENAIRMGLNSASTEVREKAIAAVGSLPTIIATTLLRDHIAREDDATLRTLATEMAADLGGE